MISFIGSGIICPDPEVEIITFALTGFGAVSRFLQQLLCLVGIIAVVLFRLTEIRIVGRVDAVGWLRRAVQELGDRIAIDCVIESLAQSLVVKHRTLTHIEDIRPDMRVRPQADLETGFL
jgi:hypothetical protein